MTHEHRTSIISSDRPLQHPVTLWENICAPFSNTELCPDPRAGGVRGSLHLLLRQQEPRGEVPLNQCNLLTPQFVYRERERERAWPRAYGVTCLRLQNSQVHAPTSPQYLRMSARLQTEVIEPQQGHSCNAPDAQALTFQPPELCQGSRGQPTPRLSASPCPQRSLHFHVPQTHSVILPADLALLSSPNREPSSADSSCETFHVPPRGPRGSRPSPSPPRNSFSAEDPSAVLA